MMEVSSSFYVRSALLARNVSAEKDNDAESVSDVAFRKGLITVNPYCIFNIASMHASLTFFSEEFGSDFLPKEQKSVQEPYNVQRIRLHVIARTTLQYCNGYD